MSGPCLCGDPACFYCGSGPCSDPDGIDRVDEALGPDHIGHVECSCGSVILDDLQYPNGPFTILFRVCNDCFALDHPPEEGPDDWDYPQACDFL